METYIEIIKTINYSFWKKNILLSAYDLYINNIPNDDDNILMIQTEPYHINKQIGKKELYILGRKNRNKRSNNGRAECTIQFV